MHICFIQLESCYFLRYVFDDRPMAKPSEQTKELLCHIGVWDPSPPLRAPPVEEEWPDNSQISLTYHPVPDIA